MVGIIAVFIGQWITSVFTQTVLASRAAAKSNPRTSNGAPLPRVRRIVGECATHIIPLKTRLLTERQSSYQALIADGSIRPVPSVKWLSGQPVVCANGHRSQFGLFAALPDYGTLACLPDLDGPEQGWRPKVERWASALLRRRRSARHPIMDRNPALDGRWCLSCPACGTDRYTFESPSLREYLMCTASPDLFWVLCHLHHRQFPRCGACDVRRSYWKALGSLE